MFVVQPCRNVIISWSKKSGVSSVLCEHKPMACLGNFLFWADEDPVDPRIDIEECCKSKCVRFLLEYQTCAKRIVGDETGEKHCTGQYFDYLSCIDKCVAPKLFTKLK